MPIVFTQAMDTQWQYLMQYVFNNDEEATAGMMGNFYAESKCFSVALQPEHYDDAVARQYTQDVNDGTISRSTFEWDGNGYGLAQWTWHTRKDGLYEHSLQTQTQMDIGDLLFQLDFVKFECTHNQAFIDMVDRMVNRQGTPQDQVYYCSNQVLEIYEQPEVYNYTTRQQFSLEIYNHYAGTPVVGNLVIVTVENPDGPYGTAFAIPQFAEEGSQVTLLYRLQEGLTFYGFVSSDVTIRADNTFIMPNHTVVVRALFYGTPVHPPSEEYDVDVNIARDLTQLLHCTISQTTAQVGELITIQMITAMSDNEVANLDIRANGVQLTITGKTITFYMPAHNVIVTIKRKKKKLLVARNPQLLFQQRRYQ